MSEQVSAPAPPQRVRPRRAWYWVPLLILVAGALPSGLLFFNGVRGLTEGLVRFTVPGSVEVSLDETGDYQIFYEFVSDFDGRIFRTPETPPPMIITVTEAGGEEVPVSFTLSEFNYDISGKAGISVAEFEIREPGPYTIDVEYTDRAQPESVLAIGHEKGAATVRTVIGAIGFFVTGAIAFIIWLDILIVRIISKNRLDRAAYSAQQQT